MIRLDRFLSDMGVASRKELKQIIRSGRIAVDGVPATAPETKLDPEKSTVSLDGIALEYRKFRYFIMNKPSGVLTASEDRKQKTVMDLLPPELKNLGLFPTGRLDKDTTGLLILTNDGDFAHRVISPKYEIRKRYIARTDGTVDERDIRAFAEGLTLRDGLKCLPAGLEKLGDGTCAVTVMEGKYHQVKRMLASVGKPVLELKRVSIGELLLPEDLKAGNIREITQKEIDLIFSQNSQKSADFQGDF